MPSTIYLSRRVSLWDYKIMTALLITSGHVIAGGLKLEHVSLQATKIRFEKGGS